MTAPSRPQRVPQLMLFLSPSGEVLAEAPGANGARQRLDLGLGRGGAWEPAIRAELIAQRERAEAQARLAAQARKTEAEGRLEFQRAQARAKARDREEAQAAKARRPSQLGNRSNFSAEELGL